MNDVDLRAIMIGLALATPLLALLIYSAMTASARMSETPPPERLRRNALLLAAAGPLALALWWLLNVGLASRPPGSIAAYVIAALVFIVAGFATGFFSRILGKGSGRDRRDPPAP